MFNPVCLVFLLMWTSVFGENCITYNFESDLDYFLNNDKVICNEAQPWQVENYTSIDMTGVPRGSSRFIKPTSGLTCDSTLLFDMSEGILEVNFYMNSNSSADFVSVFVTEVNDDLETIHAHTSFSQNTPGYKDGWNVLRIDLLSSFTGYISFMGEQSEGSTVLIDSFRYYTQSFEEECRIYDIDEISISTTTVDEIVESTTEISTSWDTDLESTTLATPTAPAPYTTDSPTTEDGITTITLPETEATTTIGSEISTTVDPEFISTTISAVDTEKCVAYNFDNDFDNLFTHKDEFCSNFDVWTLNNYSASGIDTFNSKGNSYLTPNEGLSCISAFPMRMSPNGVVEVNVYIEPASELDYVVVLVKNVVEGSVDTVAGSYIYEPSVSSFVTGWNVLRVNVVNLRSFDGYLIFLGGASEGSTVLVDSFRYIPPWASADDEECQFH